MSETHETAVEHVRHALMFTTEAKRRLLAALTELEAEPDRCERPLLELEQGPEQKDEGQ
jgi:hypothetical protein